MTVSLRLKLTLSLFTILCHCITNVVPNKDKFPIRGNEDCNIEQIEEHERRTRCSKCPTGRGLSSVFISSGDFQRYVYYLLM